MAEYAGGCEPQTTGEAFVALQSFLVSRPKGKDEQMRDITVSITPDGTELTCETTVKKRKLEVFETSNKGASFLATTLSFLALQAARLAVCEYGVQIMTAIIDMLERWVKGGEKRSVKLNLTHNLWGKSRSNIAIELVDGDGEVTKVSARKPLADVFEQLSAKFPELVEDIRRLSVVARVEQIATEKYTQGSEEIKYLTVADIIKLNMVDYAAAARENGRNSGWSVTLRPDGTVQVNTLFLTCGEQRRVMPHEATGENLLATLNNVDEAYNISDTLVGEIFARISADAAAYVSNYIHEIFPLSEKTVAVLDDIIGWWAARRTIRVVEVACVFDKSQMSGEQRQYILSVQQGEQKAFQSGRYLNETWNDLQESNSAIFPQEQEEQKATTKELEKPAEADPAVEQSHITALIRQQREHVESERAKKMEFVQARLREHFVEGITNRMGNVPVSEWKPEDVDRIIEEELWRGGPPGLPLMMGCNPFAMLMGKGW
jgi:hypothetical protein